MKTKLMKANMLLAEAKKFLAEHDMNTTTLCEFGEKFPEDICNAALAKVEKFIEDREDYWLDDQGLIRVKLGCNWFIAAYDGCTPDEMQGDYSAMIMGY